jgi:hypothetical protein
MHTRSLQPLVLPCQNSVCPAPPPPRWRGVAQEGWGVQRTPQAAMLRT